jgi:hypothetical protein
MSSDPLDISEPVPPSLDAEIFEYLCKRLPGGTQLRQAALARQRSLEDDLADTGPIAHVKGWDQ